MQRIALVTGANRGLGFEIARQLGHAGLHVLVAARDPERGRDAVGSLRTDGVSCERCRLDVTCPDQVEALCSHVTERHGRLDALVNNAGISADHWQPPSELGMDVLRRTFDINFFGAFAVTRALLPLLRASDAGRIVFMSSSLGSLAQILDPKSDFHGVVAPAYQASKTALNALTVLFARELADTSVKVNSACPGWVRTRIGGEHAPDAVATGADTPVWLALLPSDGPTGGFFRNRSPVPW